MDADVTGFIQCNIRVDVDHCLTVGATFRPDGVVTVTDAAFTVHHDRACSAGGDFGIFVIGANVDPYVVGAIHVNLAVVTDFLIIFCAAVVYGDAVVLTAAPFRTAIDHDIAGIEDVARGISDQNPRSVTDAGSQRDKAVVNHLFGALDHNTGAQAGTACHGDIFRRIACVATKINRGILSVGKGGIPGDFYAISGAAGKGCTAFTSVYDVNLAIVDPLCIVRQLHTNRQRQRRSGDVFAPGIGCRSGTKVIGGDRLVDDAVVSDLAGALTLHTKCAIAVDVLVAVFIDKQPGVDHPVVGCRRVFCQHANRQALPGRRS